MYTYLLKPGFDSAFQTSNMAFVPTAESMFSNHEDAHFPSSSSSAPQDLQDFSQFSTRTSTSYSGLDRAEDQQPDDDVSDYICQLLGDKKRRLNVEQVKALEKSFELGSKLGPERKMQLSRALGLHPRQITIWFQNRRARWKTKQLEKDYDVLKRQIGSLKADNDALKSQNKELQSQLLALKVKSRESAHENSCNINLNALSADNIIYHHSDNKNAVVSVGPGASTLTQLLHPSLRPDHQFQGPAHEPFRNVFSGLEGNHHLWQ